MTMNNAMIPNGLFAIDFSGIAKFYKTHQPIPLYHTAMAEILQNHPLLCFGIFQKLNHLMLTMQ